MSGVDMVSGDIRLVPATPEICDGPYFDWMQDPDVLRHLEARFSDRSHEGLRTFVEGCLRNPDQHLFSICLPADGRHVGNIKLQVDPRHHRGDIGILIGERAARGRGLGVQAIEAVCHYAFETLDLKKVTAGCYAPNVASIKAFTRAGFVIEATRPSHFVFENIRVDGVFMARLNEISS